MERSKRKVKLEPAIDRFGYLALVIPAICIAILLAGCSSGEVATNSPGKVAKSQRNGTTQNDAPANTTAGENPILNTENNGVPTATNRVQEKIDRMRAAASNSVPTAPADMNSRPAPEDSVMTTQLTDVARETRVFNKHPLLKKVEKVHDSKGGSIKVYLRDGRVFDLPGTSITQLATLPSLSILQLVGITPPQVTTHTKNKLKEQEAKKAEN